MSTTIRERCSCGAEFEVSGETWEISDAPDRWRARHRVVCDQIAPTGTHVGTADGWVYEVAGEPVAPQGKDDWPPWE